MGRFMTPDWAARPTSVPYAVFGDPQSLNLYTYVRNDPVTNADADGHMCSWSSAVGTGIVCNVGDNSAPAKNQQGGQAQAQNQSQYDPRKVALKIPQTQVIRYPRTRS